MRPTQLIISAFSIASPSHRSLHFIPVFFCLLIATCGCSRAQIARPTAPDALTDTETAGLSGDASIDIHAVTNYSRTVSDLLKAEKFEQIERLADSARSHRETFAGGMWKLHALYAGLAQPPLHATEEDWAEHMELLQRWNSARPDSITAHIAQAESYLNYGAEARGTGFADTVSQSGWKLLAERTAKSEQILDEASRLSTKDPEWYAAMQTVALGEWTQDARRSLFEQAIKFEPSYYYYYRAYAYSILPKWGGEEGGTEKFLETEANRIGGDAGDILYFRVAGTLVCGCPSDQGLKLSWPRIQNGFAAIEKQNGPSPENRNLLAHMAVSFSDASTADQMFAKIGDQWSEEIWQSRPYFDSSKQWAKQAGPFLARKHAAEEFADANLHTPEGQRFKTAFDDRIHGWMQPCVDSLSGNDLGNFELLIKVGKEGTIDDITGGGNSPLMSCLGRTISDYRVNKKVALPPPPQADYWFRLDFKQGDSISAVLK